MEQFLNSAALWFAFCAVLLFELLRRTAIRAWDRYQRRRVQISARRSEARARKLVERAGYRITAEHPRAIIHLAVDRAPVAYEVIADFLAEHAGPRGGERVVVEVKHGEHGSSLGYADTRRQLLEYAVAFEVDAVLFVDMRRGRVQRVTFPGLVRAEERAA